MCGPISTLTLDEGVTSYTQLYGEKENMVKVDNSNFRNCKIPIPKVPWDCKLKSTGTDVATPEPSAPLLSNWWKNGERLDVYWKIDFKICEENKENKQSHGEEENSESFFAQPAYEANWNKIIFDPGPETPESQQQEL